MVRLGIAKTKTPPPEVSSDGFVEQFNAFDAAKERAQARAHRAD